MIVKITNAILFEVEIGSLRVDQARADIEAVLAIAPDEVPSLLATVRQGRIDGSVYTGSCACLVGTVANIRGCRYDEMPDLRPDADRPAEVWFRALRPGHTEAVSIHAALTCQWIEAWMRAGEREVR
jgi:hypothetical protein